VLTRLSMRVLTAVAVLMAALSLVACGGDDDKGLSKDDYKDKAQQISDKLETDQQTAQQNLQSGQDQEALTGLNQFKSALTDARTKLDDLEPPSDFKDVHDKLVAELQKSETSTQAVVDAAKSKDKAKVQTSLQDFQTNLQSLKSAGDAFDKKVGTT
jgi:hypothetical protein